MRKRTGFTLVELLVVVGIIALLIAVLLPALNRARASAQQLQCLSNMRQVGMSFRFYASDNDQWLPFGRYEGYQGNTGQNISWDDLLLMGKYGLFRRPLDFDGPQGIRFFATTGIRIPLLKCPRDPAEDLFFSGAWRITYGVNGGVSNGSGPFGYGNHTGAFGVTPIPPGAKLDKIGIDTILMTEFPAPNNALGGGYGMVGAPSSQLTFTKTANKPGLHGYLLNYIFADGHGESLRPADTIGGGSLSNPEGTCTKKKGD